MTDDTTDGAIGGADLTEEELEAEVQRQNEKIWFGDPSVLAHARQILKEGDPIAFILSVLSRLHVGDEPIHRANLAAVGCQLCSNTLGLHPGLTGESGKGKSAACGAFYHLLSPWHRRRGSFSPLALFYDKMEPGTVIFLDDAANINETFRDLIKQASTDYQSGTIRTTVIKGKVKYLEVPPRTMFMITSVDNPFELQFLNRTMALVVNDTPEQDTAVARHFIEGAKTGAQMYPNDSDVLTCRAIFYTLKRRPPVAVVMPWADHIGWGDHGNRRNLPMFLDTIKGYAALFQDQRERTPDGQVVATRDDFKQALILWQWIAGSQVSKMTRDDMVFLQTLMRHGTRNIMGSMSINREDIARVIRWPSYKMSRAIYGRDGHGGLLEKLKGFEVHKETVVDEDSDGNRRTRQHVVFTYSGTFNPLNESMVPIWWIDDPVQSAGGDP